MPAADRTTFCGAASGQQFCRQPEPETAGIRQRMPVGLLLIRQLKPQDAFFAVAKPHAMRATASWPASSKTTTMATAGWNLFINLNAIIA